jgi:hypothetical protein
MALLPSNQMENDIISKIKAADQAKKNALRGLHKELGYPTAQALADAIVEAAQASSSTAAAAKQPKAPATTTAKRASGTKRPRISEETKQAIGEALKAGEPGNQLTTRFGVSYGIIHQIKTKLGLVSKKKASKRRG